jgi:hypothetical protein
VGSTRVRFVLVALVVSLFAIGMVAFLNYFKYRATVGEMVQSRVLVVGRGIENSVQASLGLGLQFAEIATIPDLLRRELSTESLLRRIDIFDHNGKILYSTDAAQVGRGVPAEWTAAAAHAKKTQWAVEERDMNVAGISLRNNFNLTVGYMALHYSRGYVDQAAARIGPDILVASLAALAGVVLFMPLLLGFPFRRVESDFAAARQALDPQARDAPTGIRDRQLDEALRETRERLAEAEKAVAQAAAQLEAAR